MGSAVFFRHMGARSKLGAAMLMTALTLTACEDGTQFNLRDMLRSNGETQGDTAAPATSSKTTERDVEAPEVFSATEAGLWDGRPSLGGVWVAHPDVKDPERVIIRNTTNNKFVVGALFRRERDIPGPRLQISSDAAEALGMLAGAPAELNVTALRKEEITVQTAPAEAATDLAEPADVTQTPLDPIASAAAAIDAAKPTAPAAAMKKPKPKPAAARPTGSSLAKPFIQIGIFSVEENAKRTAGQMRNAGLVPTVKRGESGGKAFWRVVVGPAQNSAERKVLLNKIKGVGFSDAYAVTN